MPILIDVNAIRTVGDEAQNASPKKHRGHSRLDILPVQSTAYHVLSKLVPKNPSILTPPNLPENNSSRSQDINSLLGPPRTTSPPPSFTFPGCISKMDPSLPALLSTLTTALTTTASALPSTPTSLAPPPDSLSLLDTKNALLLSYLHNLSFLILLKLRHQKTLHLPAASLSTSTASDDLNDLNNQVVHSLTTLRIYLDKGVRPLEAKLKYQIDKVLHAAEDASTSRVANAAKATPDGRASPGSDSPSTTSSSSDDNSDNEDNPAAVPPPSKEIDELTYRPNPSSLLRPSSALPSNSHTASKPASSSAQPYRPPRLTSTLPPTTTTSSSNPKNAAAQKSRTLNEFLTTELSAAPLAEPSIGSNFTNHGRSAGLGTKEREKREERRVYEESNFVRLPKESKKQKGKKAGRGDEGGYGGEDWRGLGEGADRVGRLVGSAGRRGEGGKRMGVLERSRKRGTYPDGDGDGDAGRGKRRRG